MATSLNGQDRIIAVGNYLNEISPLAAPVSKIAVMTLMSESQVRAALREICPSPIRLKRGATVLYLSVSPSGR